MTYMAAAPPLSYRVGGTDAQVRNGAGLEMTLVVPDQHFVASLVPAGALTRCAGGYTIAHRTIAILVWYVAFIPADGSMNHIVFADTVVRLAWINALFAAIEPEVDVSMQLSSIDTVVAYLVEVISSSTQPIVWLRGSLQRPICLLWLICRRSPKG